MRRNCGECTLCCKLLPVPELEKLAGARCAHHRAHKGCAIYKKRPLSCRVWSCEWLNGGDMAAGLSRPDRAHYVIDCMPDFVTMTYPDSPPRRLPVIQVWLDPKHPDAHRDPALRRYIEARSDREGGVAAIVRYDNESALVIFPPGLAEDGQWHEEQSNLKTKQHSFAEIAEVLAGG